MRERDIGWAVWVVLALVGSTGRCHCENWDINFGAEHKTGTFLLQDVIHFLRQSRACDEKERQSVSGINSHFHQRILRNRKYVLMVRDPFAVVSSGYRYHLGGAEDVVMRGKGEKRTLYIGLNHLFARGESLGLPRAEEKEGYVHYLRRLNETEGILAQMLRSEKTYMPNIVYMAQQRGKSNVLVTCLEQVEQSGTDWFYRRVLSFVNFSVPCVERRGTLSKALESGNRTRNGHGTSHDRDEIQQRIARDLDLRYFDGEFAAAAATIACEGRGQGLSGRR
mmetsp:Transcript_6474/g.18344  ORF Transcript_6474/g.18344 Transcript_6474/m.18344 type:complete len:280 (+) Transcript_6474:100-939(+)